MSDQNKQNNIVSKSGSNGMLCGSLDTGDLVNDPLYQALDKLYERGWIHKHKERDYDPRGTIEWQSVLDLFRLQKETFSPIGARGERGT